MTMDAKNSDSTLLLSKFASEIEYDKLPGDVVALTKMVLLDTVGVMLAATTLENAVVPLVRLVKEGGGKAESTLIGFGGKVPCWMAAFANGALSHALDYACSNNRGVAPGGVTVPSAMAMAERIQAISGKQLITAIAAGNEVLVRIANAITRNPMDFGWVAPMLLGVFGSAVAAGKTAGLNPTQIMDAIGIALHQAGGTWEMSEDPKSTFRAVRNCFVNKTGVMAALMAQDGMAGAKNPLEGKHGLYSQYFQGVYNPSVLTDGLGSDFQSAAIGFKPYPSCRDTHTSIDAALSLARKYDFAAADVEEIRLTVSPMGEKLCLPLEQKCQPQTSIEAKFSLPFTVATAIVRRRVALIDFSPSGLEDPAVVDLAHRFSHRLSDSEGTSGIDPGIIDIRLKDGRILHEEIEHPSGSLQSPMSPEDLVAKFRDCASYSCKSLQPSDVDRIIDTVLGLEQETNLSGLTAIIG